jgi:hypothetical protein
MGILYSKPRVPQVSQNQLDQLKNIVYADQTVLVNDRETITNTENIYNNDIDDYHLYLDYFNTDSELYTSSNLASLKGYLNNIINDMNAFLHYYDRNNTDGIHSKLENFKYYCTETYLYIYLYKYCTDKNTVLKKYVNGDTTGYKGIIQDISST